MIFLLFLLNIIDINTATLSDLKTLPLSEEKIESIYELRLAKGYLRSVYELREVLSRDEFNRIKGMIKTKPPEEEDWTAVYIEELQEKLASEEGPTQSAIDKWQAVVLDPIDINKASIDEILMLNSVNLVDAVSAIKYRTAFRKLRYVSDLEDAPYLSSYGFRNMRNFIVAGKPEKIGHPIDGFAKMEASSKNSSWEEGFDLLSPDNMTNSLSQVIEDMEDTSATLYKRLIADGWSERELLDFQEKLTDEKEGIKSKRWTDDYSGKFHSTYGENIFLGGGVGEYYINGYAGVQKINFLKNTIIGDYHYSTGMGLVFDNSPDSRPRSIERVNGLFGDATENPIFRARGIATHLKEGRFNSYLFYSKDTKPGIPNSDGTVNCYFPNRYRLENFDKIIDEQLIGGHLGIDLSEVLSIPFGTYIGINGYRAQYGDSLDPQVRTIDIPNDNYELGPSYTGLFHGKQRDIGGIEGRLVYRNLGIQGEYAKERGRGVAYAYQARVLYNNLYVLFHRRHYEVDFDNPYSRGFWEQERFDDTPIEKSYRVLDPLYSDLSEYPVPKPEDGYYIETRAQFNRKLTLTRAYLDLWKNLAVGTSNMRFQWEVEFRPIYPLRLRFKHKYQEKNRSKVSTLTASRTNEVTFRTFVLLSNRDYLGFRVRYGKVQLTQSPRYSMNDLIDGGYIGAFYEHNFSTKLGVKGGIAFWKSNGMSQWIFEDIGLDFLYGDGRKFYLTVLDRLSDNIYLRFKFRVKTQIYPHWGLAESGEEYYNSNGELIDNPSGFYDETTISSGNINLTWWW